MKSKNAISTNTIDTITNTDIDNKETDMNTNTNITNKELN